MATFTGISIADTERFKIQNKNSTSDVEDFIRIRGWFLCFPFASCVRVLNYSLNNGMLGEILKAVLISTYSFISLRRFSYSVSVDNVERQTLMLARQGKVRTSDSAECYKQSLTFACKIGVPNREPLF